jgi:predicted HTH domain antitoxin
MEQEKITIKIPSEMLPLVAKKRKDLPSKVLEYLILELYRLGELSSGKAAQYLDMGRFEFIKFASTQGIPFVDMDKGEVSEDFKRARKAASKEKT